MLLGEPPRTQFDLSFRLFGIPVRVHPWFWLISVLLGGQLRDPVDVLSWVVAVFLAVLIHELGHAAAMRLYGFQPWIVLYGLGGATSYDLRSGYRSSGTGTLAQVLIAFAGPLAGFLLAGALRLVFIMMIYLQWQPNGRILLLLFDIYSICIYWGIINLLPVYPLDGGQIARELLLKLSPRHGIRLSLILSLSLAVVIAITSFVLWHSLFMAMMFGYLAYASYAALTAYTSRGPW